MQLGKVIAQQLLDDATVVSYVGDKIFPIKIPQGQEYPCIVYTFDSQVPTLIKQAASPLDVVGCQLTIYNDDYASCEAIAEACRSVLDQLEGTIEGVVVDEIIFDGASRNDFIEEYGFFVIEQTYQARLKR
jgi:hypothetical protein